MYLLQFYLSTELKRLIKNDIRLSVIGQRSRLRIGIQERIARAETETAQGQSLHLRIALDYSARDAILRAAAAVKDTETISRETFSRALGGAGDVDLLIRTGGEQRLSDFLLWECAYSEILFTKRYWPDFNAGDLSAALADFNCRERRFGQLPSSLPVPHSATTEPARHPENAALTKATA
jgi:undecaprenyl diphosphate synthase